MARLSGRRVAATAGLVLAASVVSVPTPVSASHAGRYHWYQQDGVADVGVKDATSGNDYKLRSVDRAGRRWDRARRIMLSYGRAATIGCHNSPPEHKVIRVCSKNIWRDENLAGGVTFVYPAGDGEHIYSAEIQLDLPAWVSPYQADVVLCHEMGHALGLRHSNGLPCGGDAWPNVHDFEQVDAATHRHAPRKRGGSDDRTGDGDLLEPPGSIGPVELPPLPL